MRICLVLEGCYPYVHGGVSTWMHGYIQAMPEHEFVLWVIGAHAADRGKFVYELPGNVVEVREVFLDDALRLSGEQHEASFNDREREALRRLVSLSNPDWDVLFDIFHRRRVHPLSFLQSRTFMDIFRDVCLAEYPYTPFADAFHTMRSMLLPVLYLLGSEVPVADVYHAISTGYGGLLACLGSSVHHAPVLLTEHGIYTREREEEIIRADWVVPSFKDRWIRFFYLLSEEIYRRAFRVTSLFHNARKTQIDMGCDADKCLVIPNGIQFDRFKEIPLKTDDGWVDIGAVVRLAPIKDVKTMIYAFFELHERLPRVRLHIMGGVDDEEYGAECHALVDTLGVRDLIFTGRVNVVEYMEKLDFAILTSISEGQPLSVLESLAARRPCVTTEVGCCRELLEGAPGDDFGVAGFVTPPMYARAWPMPWSACAQAAPAALRWGSAASVASPRTFCTSRCSPTIARCTTRRRKRLTCPERGSSRWPESVLSSSACLGARVCLPRCAPMATLALCARAPCCWACCSRWVSWCCAVCGAWGAPTRICWCAW